MYFMRNEKVVLLGIVRNVRFFLILCWKS